MSAQQELSSNILSIHLWIYQFLRNVLWERALDLEYSIVQVKIEKETF